MKKNLLLSVLTILCTFTAAAGENNDFTRDINSIHNRYGYGKRVIYEMNIGSMTPEGTFKAAAERLEELKVLGIDVVWLMPVYPRGEDENSIGSPYASKDFSKVNPSYGTVDDMRAFVKKAHELNLEVWLDWVPNHTATDNVWTETHADFFRYNEDGSLFHPFSGPIKYNDVAQLDYDNPALAEAMTASMEYWLAYTGLDGLRCDFVGSPFMRKNYWHEVMPRLKAFKSTLTKEPITMLGEADFFHAKHLYDAGWDYDYAWSFNDSLLAVGHGNDAARLQRACEELINDRAYDNLDRMVYLTNHDANHNDHVHTLAEKFGDNRYSFTVLTFTLYGMPLLYNGQEIGDHQDINYFEDTKIDWSLSDDTMTNLIRTLTAMKHTVPAIQDGKTPSERGETIFLDTKNPEVLAYLRKQGDSEALVILNLGKPTTIKLTDMQGQWTQWLDAKNVTQGPQQKTVNFAKKQSLKLGAHGYQVYVK